MESMIITLKNRTKEGFFKCEIKPAIGERYYREFTAAALQQYILDSEAYCEWKGYQHKVIIPNQIRQLMKAELIKAMNQAN